MSYSLADTTGVLEEFASIGGMRDFSSWALNQTPTIRRFVSIGVTEDLDNLRAELASVQPTALVREQYEALIEALKKAEDILIITDGMSDEDFRSAGGSGSGNFGHQGGVGGKGNPGGSSKGSGPALNALGQTLVPNGLWNESHRGEKPYGWLLHSGDSDYNVPTITHKVVRDNGMWGSSHGNSQMMTGAAAEMMGIPGYRGRGQINDHARGYVTNFLGHIASDVEGSEEQLHHSFENVRKTDFNVGDTLRLPLTATSGDIGGYGIRLDAESQSGQPVVFEFEKGTQMVAYSESMTAKDAKDMGYASLDEARKDVGHVWSEALVAGGFKVTSVRTEYMGSQHSSTQDLHPGSVHQIYGKVVRLKQIETWDPKGGWKPRG